MKFGIFLPLQCPRPWREDTEAQLIHEALEQAVLADRLGYDCVWTQEHHFLEEYSHASAPEVLLAAISQRTQQIRLGHGVMLTAPAYNHPVRCAERIAMLDQVSRGRVEWGSGCSGSHVELEAFGIDPADKHAMWEEGLRTALRLLTEEPFSGVAGQYVQLPARNLVPKSAQRPHPPLWLACSNRASLRRAAQLGMGALTFAFVDAEEAKHWVDEYYEVFETTCHPIGSAVNPNVAMLSNFVCHQDRARARELGLAGAEFFAFGLGHYFRSDEHVPAGTDLGRACRRLAQRPFIQPRCFDTPEALAEHYQAFEQAGVDQIILLQQAGDYAHSDICASLELFAHRALPEFKERAAGLEASKQRRLAAAVQRAQARVASQPAAPARPAPQPRSLGQHRTLLDVLQRQAAERPQRHALCELNAAGEVERALSYAELLLAVESQAAALALQLSAADRVLVLADSGAPLLIAMLAVMRAGGVPVLLPRPDASRATARWPKLLDTLSPRLVLGARSSLTTLAQLCGSALPACVAFEDLAAAVAAPLQSQAVAELALIQYTSGSQHAPKGVPITHDMLLASLANTREIFGFTSADRFLSVLSLHHTFGLMVHALSALYVGGTCFLLDPLAFVADPGVWLRAISRHQVSVSGAPNFAYALCARLSAPLAVDLSSWRLAINGGEPALPDTLEAFCARWQAQGLVRSACVPSYGLTEATGAVTGQRGTCEPRRLQLCGPIQDGARLGVEVSCLSNGRVGTSTDLVIVEASTRRRLEPGQIGEIWLAGAGIAAHYLERADEPSERFAELPDSPGQRYLRTGDVGAVIDGELYLLGRSRDLILVRGENFLPQDIEAVALQSCRDLDPGAAVALGIEDNGTQAVALLIEVTSPQRDLSAPSEQVREALAQSLGISIAQLRFVPRHALPRSPLGKLKRAEARALLLESASEPCAGAASESEIEQQLAQAFSRALKRSAIPPTSSFFALGGDSLQAAELLANINAKFGSRLMLSDVVGCLTIGELARRLRKKSPEGRTRGSDVLARFDQYEARVLAARDSQAAASCLAGAFRRLPMVQALAPTQVELETLMWAMAEASAPLGLSLALYHVPSGRMVGCGLCDDYAAWLQTPALELPAHLAAGLAIQEALDQRFLASAGAPAEPTVHMNLLGLDREHEGRELPGKLVELTLDLAVSQGYRAAIAHAASPVVQAILCERFAFSRVGVQPYSSYEYAGRRPFESLPVSDAMLLVTRSLADWPRRAALP